MAATVEAKDKHKVEVHYLNSDVPCFIEEIEGCFYGPNDIELSEIFLQESLYQSLQGSSLKDANTSSSSSSSSVGPNHDQSSSRMGSCLRPVIEEPQLTEDEVLARNLQEMEDQLALTSISELSDDLNGPTLTTDTGSSSTGTSEMAPPEDDIDPDNMTYEELQSLGDAIGVESKGLSDEIISVLPTSRYKTGFFSRKSKNEQCVICYTPYKNREVIMTLPCSHSYHSECIRRWLKINKACPICNKEVFGS